WAALKLAATLDKPATIVTVIPDSGVKYMSKFYNDDWMLENGHRIEDNN
ncbi:MAG: cystathionine beta-synthase, partial [Gammaproteobacteria bacterium]|nr:cystathionine beta-synthase [Gammaproteobacteria bacterium]